MHGKSLAVQHLPIHLPNEHYVNFHAHQTVNEVLAKQNVEKTQLTTCVKTLDLTVEYVFQLKAYI